MIPVGAALVTGCSTGIGRATAIALQNAGLPVVATARKLDAIADLGDRGMATLTLDVADEDSMTAAVAQVAEQAGHVGVLVNNAGYGLYGPVEQTPMSEVRRQFETNTFGTIRMCQVVLPGMRKDGAGRILNVTSMGGRTTLPGGAFYHASKHAVEAFSDAFRLEVAPFGVDVVLIEPGPVQTPWNEGAAGSVPAAESADDPYADFKNSVRESFGKVTGGPLTRLTSTPQDIAAVIVKAVTANRPKTRYLINPFGKGMVAAKAVLPDRVHDALLRQQYDLQK